MSVAGTQPSRGGSVLSASFNGRAPLAQSGVQPWLPCFSEVTDLELGPGFAAPPQLFLMVKVWGPGRQAVLVVATSACFSVLGLALGDLLG